MDTLFNTNFNLKPSTHNEKRVSLTESTFELLENSINLKLTIVETSGFGDQINKENSHEPIVKYISEQFEHYVQQELNLKRYFKQINDTRIHVCLYFICPTGHSLKAIDLKTMKALDRKVNILPIIAKADTISKNELIEFKKRIMIDLNNNHVNLYQFPINDFDLNVSNMNAAANVRYFQPPFFLHFFSFLVVFVFIIKKN
jgi:septin 6/8/11